MSHYTWIAYVILGVSWSWIAFCLGRIYEMKSQHNLLVEYLDNIKKLHHEAEKEVAEAQELHRLELEKLHSSNEAFGPAPTTERKH